MEGVYLCIGNVDYVAWFDESEGIHYNRSYSCLVTPQELNLFLVSVPQRKYLLHLNDLHTDIKMAISVDHLPHFYSRQPILSYNRQLFLWLLPRRSSILIPLLIRQLFDYLKSFSSRVSVSSPGRAVFIVNGHRGLASDYSFYFIAKSLGTSL